MPSGHEIQLRLRGRALALLGGLALGVDRGGRVVALAVAQAGHGAGVARGAGGPCGEVEGGQDELLLLRGREDLVEVDGDAERDEKEAAYAGADPVGGREGWRGDELGP